MKNLKIKRKDNEPPFATETLGWRYHHLGIPVKDPIPGERYISKLKMYVSGFETSPFGIEWMRFENDCPISEPVKTFPHIAFEVDSLDEVLKDFELDIISKPDIPSDGVRTVMIRHHGALIELIEFNK